MDGYGLREDARPLIEGVYGEDAAVPEGLQARAFDAQGDANYYNEIYPIAINEYERVLEMDTTNLDVFFRLAGAFLGLMALDAKLVHDLLGNQLVLLFEPVNGALFLGKQAVAELVLIQSIQEVGLVLAVVCRPQ